MFRIFPTLLLLSILCAESILAQGVRSLTFRSGLIIGTDVRANANFNPGTTFDTSYILELGFKREADVIRYSIGLMDDEFTTSFRYQEPIQLPNGVWMDRNRGESITTSYVLHAGIGYSTHHINERLALIPIVSVDVQLLTVLGSMRTRTGIIATDIDDASTYLLTDYHSFDRRMTPFLAIGGSYELFEGNRLSFPISFGYRIPVFRRYQYSDGFVTQAGMPVTFQRVEKSGFARHVQIGMTYRF